MFKYTLRKQDPNTPSGTKHTCTQAGQNKKKGGGERKKKEKKTLPKRKSPYLKVNIISADNHKRAARQNA